MRLCLSKLLAKLLEKYLLNKATLKESSTEDSMRGVCNDAYEILFPIFFNKACVVGTHMNCLDLLRQFI